MIGRVSESGSDDFLPYNRPRAPKQPKVPKQPGFARIGPDITLTVCQLPWVPPSFVQIGETAVFLRASQHNIRRPSVSHSVFVSLAVERPPCPHPQFSIFAASARGRRSRSTVAPTCTRPWRAWPGRTYERSALNTISAGAKAAAARSGPPRSYRVSSRRWSCVRARGIPSSNTLYHFGTS